MYDVDTNYQFIETDKNQKHPWFSWLGGRGGPVWWVLSWGLENRRAIPKTVVFINGHAEEIL